MNKKILCLFLAINVFATCALQVHAQTQSTENENLFRLYLDLGKAEFNKDFEEQNYKQAVTSLQEAVKLKPNDPEALYFLAYAYSRLNAKDGRDMIHMQKNLTLKCSETFEKVIELSPKYKGESLILHPYAKLSSEWGSLAMAYYYRNEIDSAKWAFKEGKERGGFSDYLVESAREMLDLCSEKSILITNGDAYTITFWYVQILQGYRTDVKVVDNSLLNTLWYPKMLVEKEGLDFGMSHEELDSANYLPWQDSLMHIDQLSWIMKASYQEDYILRSDHLLLKLLMQNAFESDVFFTVAFPEESKLSLADHLSSHGMIEKVDWEKSDMAFEEFSKVMKKFLAISKKANENSPSDLVQIDIVRYYVIDKASKLYEGGRKQESKKLMKMLEKYTPEEKYPYRQENTGMYAQYLMDLLDDQ